MNHLTLSVENATDLVMGATTRSGIKEAQDIISHPEAHGFKKGISDYQQSMYLKQLEINDCNLAINGSI